MRIALICRALPIHKPTEIGFVVQDRAAQLAADGHNVHILTTGNPVASDCLDGDVHVHHLDCRPREWSDEFGDAAEAWCKTFRPHVLHIDGTPVGREWWRSRPGDPQTIACTVHSTVLGGFLSSLATDSIREVQPIKHWVERERNTLQGFDRVLVTNPHERWVLEDVGRLANVRLVWNPIAACFFDKRSDPADHASDERRFVCVARSAPELRGFGLAERAAKAARVPIQCVDVGDREKMPYVYDAASALVLPTCIGQGCDLAVAESLARQRPVIVSDLGAYYHLARDPEIGEYIRAVKVDDAEGLAAAMQAELPKDVSLRAADRWHPAQHVRKWLEVCA